MSTPKPAPEKPVPCRHAVAVGECDYPYGHDGPHHTEVELPPHINQGLGAIWNDLERQRRRYRIWRYWFMVGTLMNVIAYIIRLIQGAS